MPIGRAGLFPAYFLAPQKPAEARALFEAGLVHAGFAGKRAATQLPGPQRTPMTVHLAREWGIDEVADRLQHAADEKYEPTWDRERGEFTWGFQLGEEHPRGQFNASFAAAEVVREGSWWRLFNVGPGNRFHQPTVAGIEFPDLAVSEARWAPETRKLVVATTPIHVRVAGRPTSFKIINLDARAWSLVVDGAAPTTVRPVDGKLDVKTTIGSHHFELTGSW